MSRLHRGAVRKGRHPVSALVIFVVAMGLASASLAQTPEELFGRGNAAYEANRYEDAVEAYETILKYGIRDARVEYNLGNAYMKLARLGPAILHYERARRLDPTDGDIRGNLELAYSRRFDRVDKPETAAVIRWIRGVQDRVGPDSQALGLLALGWLAAGLVTWASARPGGWNVTVGWSLAVLLILGALLGASWYSTYDRLEGTQLAVVLTDSVDVLAGPGENNASLFTVHEGLTMEVRSARRDWVQVSLPNGLHGWVPKATVGMV